MILLYYDIIVLCYCFMIAWSHKIQNVCFLSKKVRVVMGGGPRGGYSGFQVTGMIEWSQKSRPKKISRASSKTQKNPRLFVLYSQNYAARALPILFNTPKKSLLKSSYPKKYLPNFRTQKNPGIENFKPKKILRSSPSLEIPSTPPGGREAVINSMCTPLFRWCSPLLIVYNDYYNFEDFPE